MPTDVTPVRAAKAKAMRRELRWSNRMSRVYTASTAAAKFYAALDVWRATVKRMTPAERDAQFERMADLLVNDALQMDSTRTEVAA